MALATKSQLAFFLTLALMLGVALFGVYELKDALGRYRTDVKAANDNQLAFDELLITFKEQVQEWKDALLRGRNPVDLERYWSEFIDRERDVNAKAAALIVALPAGESRSLLEQFASAHDKLSLNYRRALERFKKAGFDPVAGDAAVRGMDREPSRLLGIAGNKITVNRTAVSAQASADGERAAIISLAAILMAGVVSFFVFLLARDTGGAY